MSQLCAQSSNSARSVKMEGSSRIFVDEYSKSTLSVSRRRLNLSGYGIPCGSEWFMSVFEAGYSREL